MVESIGGIDGTPPSLDIHSVHMHGHVGASFIVASNLIVVDATSNYVVVASNYASKHNRQPGKKQFKPFECVITSYSSATNPYKKSNEAQQHFF